MSDQTPRPLLEGITVIDLSRVLAGPYCSQLLADHGATVIKVETPHGDDSRHLGPFITGPDGQPHSAYFTVLNRGKQSVTLNLKDPADHAALMNLISTADVLVENFRPGVAARLGIDPAAVHAQNPRLVYASISGFGQTSSQATRPAYDSVIQAMSGLMAATGKPDGEPTRIGESIADVAAGAFAAFAIASALVNRQERIHLDIPMFDVMLAMQPTNVSVVAATGTSPVRVGNRHPISAPFDTYATIDAPIVIAVANNKLFAQLCQVIGKPELATDPRFDTDAHRLTHELELRAELEAWLSTYTAEAACAELGAHGIPCAQISGLAETLDSDLAQEKELKRREPRYGVTYVPQPITVNGQRPEADLPAPYLGEHNAELNEAHN